MKRPNVAVENYEAVYDFYRHHQQNKLGARLGYAALSKIFTPNIYYADGAEDELREIVQDNDTSLIIASNHLTYKDHYAVAAAAYRTPLRQAIGTTRVLAKDSLFHGVQRPFVDMMGSVPVFRSKNYDDPATIRRASLAMVDAMTDRLVDGDSVAIFPEGTCNMEYPETLLPLHSGIGHLAVRAAQKGAAIAVATMGVSYGEKLRGVYDTDVRDATVYINRPIVGLPDKPSTVTNLVAGSLQHAVDRANKLS